MLDFVAQVQSQIIGVHIPPNRPAPALASGIDSIALSDSLTGRGLISPPRHLIPPAALRLHCLNVPQVCRYAQVEGAAGAKQSKALSGGNAVTPGRSQVPLHRLTQLPATGPAPLFAIIRKSLRGDHATLWSSMASVERPRLPDSVAESRFKKSRDKWTEVETKHM